MRVKVALLGKRFYHLLIYSLTHLLTYSLTHLLTYSFSFRDQGLAEVMEDTDLHLEESLPGAAPVCLETGCMYVCVCVCVYLQYSYTHKLVYHILIN